MKIKLTIFVAILVLFTLTGCCFSIGGLSATVQTTIPETTCPGTAASKTTAQSAKENGEYNIGDTGPAGGLIFYVNPDYKTDGWRYLEAAPGDQSIGIQWYNRRFITTGATPPVVGTGQANTQTIIKAQGSGNYAAKLCNDLTQGGLSDWFLPSKDELNEMYINLHLKGLGDFTENTYWSSSESSVFNAWSQYFYNGIQYNYYYFKFNFIYVRAVRAF